MLELIKGANLALRFLLELCVLAALGYWGFKIGSASIGKIALGIGAPLVVAVVWGVFVSPNAAVALPWPVHLLLELVIFGLAAAALYAAERPTLGWVLALVFVINRVLMYVWEQ